MDTQIENTHTHHRLLSVINPSSICFYINSMINTDFFSIQHFYVCTVSALIVVGVVLVVVVIIIIADGVLF